MGPMLLVTIAGLLALGRGYPADNDKDSRIDRPSTEESPQVFESNLDALLESIYGNNSIIDVKKQNSTTTLNSNIQQSTAVSGSYNPTSVKYCTCVKQYLCNSTKYVNSVVEQSKCDSPLEKCCEVQDMLSEDNFSVTTSQPTKNKNKCGTRTSGMGFELGGNDEISTYGEFPWMAAVLQPQTLDANESFESMYVCGGSLIHPQVVLTGAHLLQGKDNLVVRVGEWDTQTKNELYPTQDVKVREVITHEQFHNGSLANDPALLILERPVDMSMENVGLICLPGPNENMDGRECTASGWGSNPLRYRKSQAVLKRVEGLPIVPKDSCLTLLRQTRLGQRFKLHESFICSGGRPGKDTCKGDGGSPLVCPRRNNPNVYVQAGIVAWGIDCGTETPGVYVNVPYFIDWIKHKLRAQDIFLDF